MNYCEYTKLQNPLNHLYNIVRIDNKSELLRGASKKSTDELIESVGKENIEIFIY